MCLARVLERWCPIEMLMYLLLFLSVHMYYTTESWSVLKVFYSFI